MAAANEPQQFGKVPTAVVLGGHLAQLGRSGLAVYLVLTATGQAWSASPAVATIAAAAGCSRRTVQLALRTLESSGLIRASGRPGGGATTYEIRASEAQLGAPRGATGSATMRNPGCAHTELTERTEAAGAAAAGFDSILGGAGIGEPMRATLSAELSAQGVTQGDAAAVISETQTGGGGTGLVVARLRDLSQRHQATATGKRDRDAEHAAGRKKDEDYRQRVAEERRTRDIQLEQYSDEQMGGFAAAVAASCTLFDGRDWRTNQGYRSAIVRYLSALAPQRMAATG